MSRLLVAVAAVLVFGFVVVDVVGTCEKAADARRSDDLFFFSSGVPARWQLSRLTAISITVAASVSPPHAPASNAHGHSSGGAFQSGSHNSGAAEVGVGEVHSNAEVVQVALLEACVSLAALANATKAPCTQSPSPLADRRGCGTEKSLQDIAELLHIQIEEASCNDHPLTSTATVIVPAWRRTTPTHSSLPLASDNVSAWTRQQQQAFEADVLMDRKSQLIAAVLLDSTSSQLVGPVSSLVPSQPLVRCQPQGNHMDDDNVRLLLAGRNAADAKFRKDVRCQLTGSRLRENHVLSSLANIDDTAALVEATVVVPVAGPNVPRHPLEKVASRILPFPPVVPALNTSTRSPLQNQMPRLRRLHPVLLEGSQDGAASSASASGTWTAGASVDIEDGQAAETLFDPECQRETAAFSRCVEHHDDIGRCDAEQRLYMQCQRIADEIDNPGGGSGAIWHHDGRINRPAAHSPGGNKVFNPRTNFAFRAKSERALAKEAIRACTGTENSKNLAMQNGPSNIPSAGCPKGEWVQPLGLPTMPPIPGPFGVNLGAIGGVIIACIINGVMGDAIRDSVEKVAVLIAKIVPPILHIVEVAGVFDPMMILAQIAKIKLDIETFEAKIKALLLMLKAIALAKIKAAAAHAMLMLALAKMKINFSLAMMRNLMAMIAHVKLQFKLKLRMMLSLLFAQLKFKRLSLYKLRMMFPKFKLHEDLAREAAELSIEKAKNATAAAVGLKCFPSNPAYSSGTDPLSQNAEKTRKADCKATKAAEEAIQQQQELVAQANNASASTARINTSIAQTELEIENLQRQIDGAPALIANRTDSALALLNVSLERAHMDAGLFVLGSKEVLLNPWIRQLVISDVREDSVSARRSTQSIVLENPNFAARARPGTNASFPSSSAFRPSSSSQSTNSTPLAWTGYDAARKAAKVQQTVSEPDLLKHFRNFLNASDGANESPLLGPAGGFDPSELFAFVMQCPPNDGAYRGRRESGSRADSKANTTPSVLSSVFLSPGAIAHDENAVSLQCAKVNYGTESTPWWSPFELRPLPHTEVRLREQLELEAHRRAKSLHNPATVAEEVLRSGFNNTDFEQRVAKAYIQAAAAEISGLNGVSSLAEADECAASAVLSGAAVRHIEVKVRLRDQGSSFSAGTGVLGPHQAAPGQSNKPLHFEVWLWAHRASGYSEEVSGMCLVNGSADVEAIFGKASESSTWRRVGIARGALTGQNPSQLLRFDVAGGLSFNATRRGSSTPPGRSIARLQWTHFVLGTRVSKSVHSPAALGIESVNFWTRVDIKNTSALAFGPAADLRTLHLNALDDRLRPYDARGRVRMNGSALFATVFDSEDHADSSQSSSNGTLRGGTPLPSDQQWLNDSHVMLTDQGSSAADIFSGIDSDATIDLDELLIDPDHYLGKSRLLEDGLNMPAATAFVQLVASSLSGEGANGVSGNVGMAMHAPPTEHVAIGRWSASAATPMIPFPRPVVRESEKAVLGTGPGGVGGVEEFRTRQLVQAQAEADLSTVGHTAGLGKTLIESLAHVLTTKLAVKLTDLLTRKLTPRITETVTVALEDGMVREVSNLLLRSLPETLARTMSLSLPAVLAMWLPGSLRQNLARTLSGVLGRGLTHTLAPSIFMTIKATRGHSVLYPALSERLRHGGPSADNLRASDEALRKLLAGKRARYAQPDTLRSALYYMDIYASYYSDYYSDIFTASTLDFLNQKPSKLQQALSAYNEERHKNGGAAASATARFQQRAAETSAQQLGGAANSSQQKIFRPRFSETAPRASNAIGQPATVGSDPVPPYYRTGAEFLSTGPPLARNSSASGNVPSRAGKSPPSLGSLTSLPLGQIPVVELAARATGATRRSSQREDAFVQPKRRHALATATSSKRLFPSEPSFNVLHLADGALWRQETSDAEKMYNNDDDLGWTWHRPATIEPEKLRNIVSDRRDLVDEPSLPHERSITPAEYNQTLAEIASRSLQAVEYPK